MLRVGNTHMSLPTRTPPDKHKYKHICTRTLSTRKQKLRSCWIEGLYAWNRGAALTCAHNSNDTRNHQQVQIWRNRYGV